MEDWQRNQGKKDRKFKFTYKDIATATGLSQRTVREYARINKYDPNDLMSLVKFISSRCKR